MRGIVMSMLLVTHDLKNQDQDYSAFYTEIKNYFHIKLSSSFYAICVKQSASYVYKKLRSSMERGDGLYVISLTRPWSKCGPIRKRIERKNFVR